jgi:hypothetical protein
MSAGPIPDGAGNVTATSPCVQCSGASNVSSRFGGPMEPLGHVPPGAPGPVLSGRRITRSVTSTPLLSGSSAEAGESCRRPVCPVR